MSSIGLLDTTRSRISIESRTGTFLSSLDKSRGMFLTADRGGDRSAALRYQIGGHTSGSVAGESMNHQRLVRPVIVSGLLLLPAVAWAQVSDTAAIGGWCETRRARSCPA